MNKTSIEWTHRPETGGALGGFTWNPIRARLVKDGMPRTGTMSNGRQVHSGTFCTRISPGCKNCYASAINMRFGTGAEYTVPNLADHEFYIDEKILTEPLERKKPSTIFVGDMFDLFHESIPDELIDGVFAVMMFARQHTFQVLTKRAHRMNLWFHSSDVEWKGLGGKVEAGTRKDSILDHAHSSISDKEIYDYEDEWPCKNVWLGVSVEDQQRADERIPVLATTPARVRFLSVEPQLKAVDVSRWIDRIDWVIVGGESGPKARLFNLAWAESLLAQCKAAGVPFFMKQAGSNPQEIAYTDATDREAVNWQRDGWTRITTEDGEHWRRYYRMKDRKGGDPAEWPERLRVREFPA